MSSKFKIGDIVEPRPEWLDDANDVPRGRIVKIESFGSDGAIYVEGELRAFAAYVFQHAVQPEFFCPETLRRE